MNSSLLQRFARILLLLLALSVLARPAAAEQTLAGQSLEQTQIAGVPVFYEPALEPVLDEVAEVMATSLATLRASAESVRAFQKKAEPIVAELNEIVGYEPGPADPFDQREILRMFLHVPPLPGLEADEANSAPIHLLLQETVRTHLRDGGTLPGFEYNVVTDEVTQIWSWSRRSDVTVEERESMSAVVIAVPDVEEAVDMVEQHFDKFRQLVHEHMIPLAMHEMIEATLFNRLQPTHPHVRWFTDGYADALTVYLLRKHLGEPVIASFLEGRDVGQFADLNENANLLSWPAAHFELRLPLASEERLELARYAFAMHEALGLIERHGVEHVGQVLDQVHEHDGTSTEQLRNAFRAVTGEDPGEHLRAYQPFDDIAEGVRYYEAQIEQATFDSQPEIELHARLRQHELGHISAQSIQRMSRLLRRLDAAELAFEPFDQVIARLGHGPPPFVAGLRHAAVIEALQHDEPQSAYEHAEQLLAEHPDDTAALTIRMHRQFTTRDFDAAETTARRVQELEPDAEQPPHRLAQQMMEQIAEQRQ